MALEYAEVPYNKIFDREVLSGNLKQYDWLHLHHEDFTGQYSKFYSYHRMPWYQQQKTTDETLARNLGYPTVAEAKKAVAQTIKEYVGGGGFLFAMCAATETLEIALASGRTDIVAPEYDHTPIDPDAQSKLKRSTIVLAQETGTNHVKYIHGNYGRGTFTFYGGHDPEDEEHLVGDPPTNLALHKNSPGYRLILNNVLFPAAKKKKRKT